MISGVALGELTWRPTLLKRHNAEPFRTLFTTTTRTLMGREAAGRAEMMVAGGAEMRPHPLMEMINFAPWVTTGGFFVLITGASRGPFKPPAQLA